MPPIQHRVLSLPARAENGALANWTVVADLWLPAGERLGHVGVIACHGLESTRESRKLRTLCLRAAARGIPAMAVDSSGCGASGGGTAARCLAQWARDVAVGAEELRARHGITELLLIGSSLGAAKALLYTAGWRLGEAAEGLAPLPVIGLFFLAPSLNGQRFRGRFSAAELEEWRQRGQRRFGDFDFPFALAEDMAQAPFAEALSGYRHSLCAVHGDRDELIPLDDVRQALSPLPNAGALYVMPGADHRFSNPEDRLRVEALFEQYIEDHIIPHVDRRGV